MYKYMIFNNRTGVIVLSSQPYREATSLAKVLSDGDEHICLAQPHSWDVAPVAKLAKAIVVAKVRKTRKPKVTTIVAAEQPYYECLKVLELI